MTPSLLVIAAAVVLPRLVTLFMPLLAIDEAIYAVFGSEMVHGALPYKDFVDYKGPIIFYLYQLGFTLGGNGNMAAVHLLHMGVVALLCWTLARIGTLIADVRTGRFAAFYYAVFSACWFSKHSIATNGEVIMVLPIAVAALLALQNDRRTGILRELFVGVFLGLGFLTKYTAGISLAITLGYYGWQVFFPNPSNRLAPSLLSTIFRRIIPCGIGFALPILLMLGLYASQGNLSDFYFWGWSYNQTYISQGATLNTWDYLALKIVLRTAAFALGSLVIWILAISTLRKTVRSLPAASDHGFIAAWFILSFISVCMGGRLFYHYYNQIVPPLCLLAALATPTWLGTSKAKARVLLLSCLLPLLFFMTEAWQRQRARAENPPREEVISTYLREKTEPTDTIFVWGYLPHVYYFADRRPATRFVFVQFLTGSSPKTNGMDFDPKTPDQHPSAWERVKTDFYSGDTPLRDYDTSDYIVPGAWDLAMEDLTKNSPRYILDTAPTNIARYGKYPIEKYPPLQKFLTEQYELETVIDQIRLYRRKNS